MNKLVRNIGQLILCKNQRSTENTLGVIEEAYLKIENGMIVSFGSESALRAFKGDIEEINARGALVSPGLIDCHSHAVFAGGRSGEFYGRLKGESYEDLQKKGGGIHSTVEKTRAAQAEDLQQAFVRRLDRFRSFGVTTLEVKSGYGLSLESEKKILNIARDAKHAVDRVCTFLGAHVVPKEYASKRSEYLNLLLEWIGHVSQEKLATFCDVFCDDHAFTIEESKTILMHAARSGLKLKMHADQLSCNDGAVLAASLGAISVDHLECVSEKGVQALSKSKTTAVLIPNANFSMGKTVRAPARSLIDSGVSVAISCDCNPGTSNSENLPFMMALAAIELKMNPVEIWESVTVNAAKALDLDKGAISLGVPADVVIWDAEHYEEIPYRVASCLPTKVLKMGDELTMK